MSDNCIVPGPEMGPNMAELCFRNGTACMQKRVLQVLDDIAEGTMGVSRASVTAAREIIARLDPMP